jgi:hypothetical protein
MAAQPVISPQTAAATQTINTMECDSTTVAWSGVATTVGDTVAVNVMPSLGTPTPFMCPSAPTVQAVLTNSTTSVTLPGGAIYQLVKNVTAGISGVDRHDKPRIANN